MSTESTAAELITIDLTKGRDVRHLGLGELIQKEALSRFAGIIGARIRAAWEAMEKPDGDGLLDADGTPLFSDRQHATIVIRGKRGSGKTTFMRNALALLETDKLDDHLGQGPEKRKDAKLKRESVVRLGVIDPTLIETKEHPFIIVVNKVKQAVELHRKKHGDGGACGGPSYRDWQSSLQDLAKGIALLDGIGSAQPLAADAWEDAIYVMQRGLDKAGASKGLEQELNQFLIKSLKFLGKKAFILGLDDIDTEFKRGWEVLELLRRYLTSPCLITIMTGDLELYSMLVRGQQWDKFSKTMLEYEMKGLDHASPGQERASQVQEQAQQNLQQFRRMVNHLQDQYLFKVLPAHSQIGLLPVSRLSIRDQIRVVARNGDGSEGPEMKLAEFVSRLVVEGFGMGAGAVPIVRELLLSQPVRSLLQVMGQARFSDDKLSIPHQELPAIFTYPLMRCGLTPEDLAGINSAGIFPILVRLLTDRQLWEGGHGLYPNHEDEDVSLSLLVLNVVLRTAMVAEPALAIGYLIRIALPYEFMAARLSQRLSGSPERLQPFIEYAGLDRRVSVTFTASRIAVAIAAAEGKAQQLGVIQVYNERARGLSDLIEAMYGIKIEKGTLITTVGVDGCIKEFFDIIKRAYDTAYSTSLFRIIHNNTLRGNYLNTIDSLVRNIKSEAGRWLASLPVCRGLRPSGEQPTYVTVHRLIALVGRLLELGASTSAEDIARLLRDEGLIRSYAQPSWVGGESKTTKGSANEGKEEIAEEPDTVDDVNVGGDIANVAGSGIVQALRTWLSQPGGGTLPPHIHSRIAARFFYTLAAIDSSIPAREFYLGRLLHRHIIAFLNAVLVEELLFLEGRGNAAGTDKASGPATLRNPIKTDQPFESNLARGAECAYFQQIFSCPLWFMYLNNGSALLEKAAYLDRKNLPYLNKDQLSEMIAVEYKIPDLHSAIKSKKSSEEAEKYANVTFDNLYDLYNSVGVQDVKATSSPAQAADQESPKSTETGKRNTRGRRKAGGTSEVTATETSSPPTPENEPADPDNEAS